MRFWLAIKRAYLRMCISAIEHDIAKSLEDEENFRADGDILAAAQMRHYIQELSITHRRWSIKLQLSNPT